MRPFSETLHCRSRLHCRACRNDPEFLAQLCARHGAFECPAGLPSPCPEERIPAAARVLARPTAQPQAPPRRCLYATDTGKRVHALRPCAGNWILCGHPDSTLPKVRGKDCGAGRCKLYEAPQ
jgi:hypothetical protein